MENVTIRTRMPRSRSELDLSQMSQDVLNSTIMDSTMLSIQSEPQQNDTSRSEEYIRELATLRFSLERAEQEISNLNSENYDLQNKIKKQEKQIELLKAISSDIVHKKTNMTPIRRKILHINTNISRTSPIHMDKSVLYNTCTSPSNSKPHVAEETCTPFDRNTDISTDGSSCVNNSTKNDTQSEKKSQIFILGDEQIKGLSKKLHSSRNCILNNPYTITTMTKTEATSKQTASSSKARAPFPIRSSNTITNTSTSRTQNTVSTATMLTMSTQNMAIIWKRWTLGDRGRYAAAGRRSPRTSCTSWSERSTRRSILTSSRGRNWP